jgi:choice-of-anchor B domain-containing protein
MNVSTGMRATLIAVLATFALALGTFPGSAASAQEGPPEHPGRPQRDVPEQSNRPSRHAPCVQGTAYVTELDGHEILGSGAFDCERVDLLSFFTNDEIGGGLEIGTGRGSDVWGWTDPATGREYVIAGLEVGTSFIDITDPKRPVYLAHLPTSASNNLIWRDIKVYADHAFIVAESADHGMQVFDLTMLRDLDPATAPHVVSETAHYDGFQRAHNVVINTDSGFAYAVGQRDDAEGCGRAMHMVDIRDPRNPVFAGCYDETTIHDAHCVIYDGPDTRFTGREICITSTGGGLSIGVVDVTDKANPVTLSLTDYPNAAFSHQGWLLDGHRYYVHNSESTTRTPQGLEILDMADLTDPQHIGFFATPAQSTHHNLYQRGRYLFQSNYSSGLRVYDTRNIADGVLEEVGFFDVYPPHDEPGFSIGSWSNYPFFDSGVVAVHGYQGLWLVKPRLGG